MLGRAALTLAGGELLLQLLEGGALVLQLGAQDAQAGVALGMSITAMSMPNGGELIRNIALFSVLIYELAGPLMTKIALTKAGNIPPKPQTPRGEAKLAKKEARGK